MPLKDQGIDRRASGPSDQYMTDEQSMYRIAQKRTHINQQAQTAQDSKSRKGSSQGVHPSPQFLNILDSSWSDNGLRAHPFVHATQTTKPLSWNGAADTVGTPH